MKTSNAASLLGNDSSGAIKSEGGSMAAILEFLKRAKPVYDMVYKTTMLICKILLVADIIIMTWVVVARYITFFPAPNWGEEVILTLMAYMSVLSASLAIRRNAHIRMTTFDRYLPVGLVKLLDLVSDLFVMGLALVMLVIGWKYATGIGSKGTYISMPWLSKTWMYMPIPVAGVAMIFFEIERLVVDIEHILDKNYVPDLGFALDEKEKKEDK